MNKIEEILREYGMSEIPFDENITMFYPALFEAMSEFGKICFEAGRKGMIYSLEETGDYCWIYENFLKEIEDETGKF